MKSYLWMFAASLALGLAVYGNALDNPFQYDDKHSIRYNPSLRSLANIPDFFTDLHAFSSDPRGAMFRPLLLVSYALNYAVHGQEVEGYRWVNLILHVVCALLVLTLTRIVSRDRILPFLAAGFFLLHPIHSEAVNLVSARSDVLVSVLYLATVLGAVGGRLPRAGVGSCFAYGAGLLTKSMAITAPAVVAAYQILQSGWHATARRWRLYGGLALVGSGYLWLLAYLGFFASSMARSPRPIWDHLLTQLKVHVYYLWLFVSPVKLSAEHQFFVSSDWSEPVVLLAGGFLLSLIGGAVLGRRHLMAQGYGWFLFAMLPATVVPLNILVSERRMYLASAGLVLAVCWVFRDILLRWGRLGIALCVAFGLAFGEMCISRNRVWASEISLWEDAVEKGPLAHRARVNLALAYSEVDRREDALRELETGLELSPRFADAWVEMGLILSDMGDLAGAEKAYLWALRFEPETAGIHYNLGNLCEGTQRLEEAIVYYRRALALNPSYADANNNLGHVREAMGFLTEAVAHYRAALEADPQLFQAWYNLGAAVEKMGKRQEAARAYSRARELLKADPDFGANTEYQKFYRKAGEGLERLAESAAVN